MKSKTAQTGINPRLKCDTRVRIHYNRRTLSNKGTYLVEQEIHMLKFICNI